MVLTIGSPHKSDLIVKLRVPLILFFFITLPGASAYPKVDLDLPQIVHEPCEDYLPGHPFTVWVQFFDQSPLFEPKIHYRMTPQTSSPKSPPAPWKSVLFVNVPQSDNYHAQLPLEPGENHLEYWIEVFDENGNGPALFGTSNAPIALSPSQTPNRCAQIPGVNLTLPPSSPPLVSDPSSFETPPPEASPGLCTGKNSPIYCSPYFIAAIGATLVATTAGAYYLLTLSPSNNGADTQPASLSITAPSPIETARPLMR